MNKGKKIRNNLISGAVYQVVLIGMGFLLPRLYLENFGSEVNGVLSTIKQVFAYLCLLEAGVGLATTQGLYGPVGRGDRSAISAILAAAKSHYRRTGFLYAGAVLLIALGYSFFANTSLSPAVLFFLILCNAAPSLFSYFVQAKYKLLLEVDGKKYIINASETAVQILSGFGKILVLLLTDSLILIQGVYCAITLCQLLFLSLYAKRAYPWLDLKVAPDFTSLAQKNAVLIHQISGMIFSNTDILLLSFLCDFKVVSVYTIYSLFFTQVQGFLTHLVSGITFALGQMMQNEREKFSKVFVTYETFYVTATSFIYTLMGIFLLPLIAIYTDGINDADYISPLLILLFVAMNLLQNGKLPVNQVLEFAGEFHSTRHHAIWEMVINLSVSILAILRFGVWGALAGTIVALIYRSVAMIPFVNRKVLNRKSFATWRILLVNFALSALLLCLFHPSRYLGLSFFPLVGKGLIHAPWIALLFFGAGCLLNPSAIGQVVKLLERKRKS